VTGVKTRQRASRLQDARGVGLGRLGSKERGRREEGGGKKKEERAANQNRRLKHICPREKKLEVETRPSGGAKNQGVADVRR